ncbi:MAG: SLC13 family permease [Promethearchaeota archaeon]
MSLLLQIIVVACFGAVIIALFQEQTDFLTYSMAAMFIAVVATFWLLPNAVVMDDFILAIEWEVVFFLIALFTIVEVLEDVHFFEEVALRITDKFHTNTRKFFWMMCLISTICAAFIEDVSVAVIFIPMIIATCQKMHINPTPFLLGMTICINLASTLTPFGSSENILIAAKFDLTGSWFLFNMGLYFIISTLLTLFFLDNFILKKSLQEIWLPHCHINEEPIDLAHISTHKLIIIEKHIDRKVFNKNLIGMLLFAVMLFVISNFLFVGLFAVIMFVLINPRKDSKGKRRPNISFYLTKVDFKLVFFFICLFILVFCMEVNGTIAYMEEIIVGLPIENLFLMCIFILIITSILSGLLDNVPVTVIFIPIIGVLISDVGLSSTPLLIAFILGINLGGNILPQGAACDMMTLEFAKKNHIHDMNYTRLLKVGGIFAIFHIILGIAYLWFIINFFY